MVARTRSFRKPACIATALKDARTARISADSWRVRKKASSFQALLGISEKKLFSWIMTLPNAQLGSNQEVTRYPLSDVGNLPLAIDLYCGLGGWADGFLSEGYRVIGFDIERHDYGTGGYPGQLVLQDVRTLRGWQFKNAAVIVASPPCQAYSYRAMPWKRAKALPPPDNTLFEQPFRIQREACEAAGRYIPLIVENVRGAARWVGPAQWHFGSFYLWGDVPALMPLASGAKVSGQDWNRFKQSGEVSPHWRMQAIKNTGGSWFAIAHNTTSGHSQNPDGRKLRDQDGYERNHPAAFGWKKPRTSSHSTKRRAAAAAAAAAIAKIPFPLAQHIARVFKPATALLLVLAFSSPRKVVMDDACKSSQFPLPFEQVTEVHGPKANPLSAIPTLPTSEPQSAHLEPAAFPQAALEQLQAKYAPLVKRVMARLSEAEQHEVNTHLKQDYRQAWICVSFASKNSTQPFVESSYACYGVHPSKVWERILADRHERLGKEYYDWFDSNDMLRPDVPKIPQVSIGVQENAAASAPVAGLAGHASPPAATHKGPGKAVANGLPQSIKIPPSPAANHAANGADTGTLGPVPQPKDKEVV